MTYTHSVLPNRAPDMHVVRHSDPDAFLAAVAPMAARGEASASLLTGWAHSLRRARRPSGERVYLATCGDGGVHGAAIARDEGPVIIGASDEQGAVAFADDIVREVPGLRGVVGAPAGSLAFARRWLELTGRAHRLRVRLRQHVLTAVNPVPTVSGATRNASETDTPWLIEHQNAFIVEVGLPESLARMPALVAERAARGDFRIWDDGGPVAYAGINDAAPDFARIAPVYTLPDRRGRGYATALVAEVSREMLARGKYRIFLTTDVANRTSNAIYARIGYRAECDEYHLDFVAPAG
jgi:predicted GNAT family acetyltransferase